MSRVNVGRVLLGGIAAGVLINVSEFILNGYVIDADFDAAMQRLNLHPDMTVALTLYLLMGFAIGILVVWLYAAFRPRFGPGPKTAFTAALVTWLLWSGLGALNFLAMGAFPIHALTVGLFWALGELIVAGMLGAWLYREPAAA